MSELSSGLTTQSSYVEIHQRFADSEYGQTLAGVIRYDRYRPEQVDPGQWRKLLGADVNCLEHMPITYGIARQFVLYHEAEDDSPVRFSNFETYVFLLAAKVHDWQEAVVGDINYELKTADDESVERTVFSRLFDEFFDLDDPRRDEVKAHLDTIIFDRDSKLGHAFNAVERIGYLRTGLRAFNVSPGQDQILTEHLEWLATSVLSNQITSLLEYAEVYPYVRHYLRANESRISAAFGALTVEVFMRHGQAEPDRHQVYMLAQTAWRGRVL
ncbi:MAG: hypothetical protein WD467_00125 [Candidatus Saccharimonadales bacterium]